MISGLTKGLNQSDKLR